MDACSFADPAVDAVGQPAGRAVPVAASKASGRRTLLSQPFAARTRIPISCPLLERKGSAKSPGSCVGAISVAPGADRL